MGLKLLIILRLAVLLNRGRSSDSQSKLSASAAAKQLAFEFDADWLAANPLTIADFEREQSVLAQVGYRLDLN